MMYRPCNAALLMLASAAVFGLQPAAAEEVANALAPAAAALEAEPVVEDEAVAAAPADAPVLSLAEVEQSATTVDEWVTQMAQAERVEITNIQIEATVDGVTLRLETTGELAAPETAVTGNAAIADIPNAVLNLPGGNEFSASDPAEGIALIDVSALPGDQVRIAITGTDAPPAVNITAVASGLVVTAAPGVPTAEAPDDSIQITVTGENENDYFVPDASTATRTDTPLRDVPNSIQVIPRQVIEDQQAIGLEEVLENAAGVSFLGDFDGFGFLAAIRGFNNAPILLDGFRLFEGEPTAPEVANLEQVEVLRGPASVLFGQSEPGGVINLVSKQPLSEPYYNLQFQVGNRGLISPSIDISGPLTEDGRVLYRLNALYRREDSFRDFDNSFNRFFIAPTITWQISDRTDLTFSLEYTDDNGPRDFGTVAFGEGIADIPPERVLGNPDATIESEYLSAGYTFKHRFSDNWQIRNQFRYISESFGFNQALIPAFFDESTGTLTSFAATQDPELDTYALYTNIQGNFNTGPVDHTLLFGVDLARLERENLVRFDPGNPATVFTRNIFDPDDSVGPFPDPDSISLILDSEEQTDRLGIYLQDQIDLLDNLILVAGLRYDTVDREVINKVTGAVTNQYDDALTPRIGIVYQPIEPISLYANYARSFTPSSSTDAQGQPLPPVEGEGFEVGIRGEIIENRLAATLAYFDITRQNVPTPDPVIPNTSIATGEQQSRGVDFNLTGEILPGWNIVASYAYIDARITEDNRFPVGNRLNGIPEHSASLWTTYEIQSGDLRGLGFGLGFNYVGERQGDLNNSFAADSHFLTNAAVFYGRNNWQFRLNVDNLFDIDYIESVNNNRTRQIFLGDPLTIRASFSYTF